MCMTYCIVFIGRGCPGSRDVPEGGCLGSGMSGRGSLKPVVDSFIVYTYTNISVEVTKEHSKLPASYKDADGPGTFCGDGDPGNHSIEYRIGTSTTS